MTNSSDVFACGSGGTGTKPSRQTSDQSEIGQEEFLQRLELPKADKTTSFTDPDGEFFRINTAQTDIAGVLENI